jgi:DNA-binding XRE family transcriptional regulator
MDRKNNERLQARNLFFGTDLTQQQIADMLNVNRKTLYGWANEGGWRRAKYSAAHAPCILVDQYYHQLGALNLKIAERTEQPWPTKEESDIIRRLTATIKSMKTGRPDFSQTVEVFAAFTDTLRHKEKEGDLLRSIITPMDKHAKSLLDRGKMLDFSDIRRLEEKEEKEYAQWLADQAAAQADAAREKAAEEAKTPPAGNTSNAQEPNFQSQIPNPTEQNSKSQIPGPANPNDTKMGSPSDSQPPQDQQTGNKLPTKNNENGASGNDENPTPKPPGSGS